MARDRKEYMKEYYKKHKAELIARTLKWQKENKEKAKRNSLNYRIKNREYLNAKQRKKRETDPNAKQKYLDYYYKNRDKISEQRKIKYRELHPKLENKK
jgi:hypothetical protein